MDLTWRDNKAFQKLRKLILDIISTCNRDGWMNLVQSNNVNHRRASNLKFNTIEMEDFLKVKVAWCCRVWALYERLKCLPSKTLIIAKERKQNFWGLGDALISEKEQMDWLYSKTWALLLQFDLNYVVHGCSPTDQTRLGCRKNKIKNLQ